MIRSEYLTQSFLETKTLSDLKSIYVHGAGPDPAPEAHGAEQQVPAQAEGHPGPVRNLHLHGQRPAVPTRITSWFLVKRLKNMGICYKMYMTFHDKTISQLKGELNSQH